jgi:hypothetical protein
VADRDQGRAGEALPERVVLTAAETDRWRAGLELPEMGLAGALAAPAGKRAARSEMVDTETSTCTSQQPSYHHCKTIESVRPFARRHPDRQSHGKSNS